jgi:hypothetical protein
MLRSLLPSAEVDAASTSLELPTGIQFAGVQGRWIINRQRRQHNRFYRRYFQFS